MVRAGRRLLFLTEPKADHAGDGTKIMATDNEAGHTADTRYSLAPDDQHADELYGGAAVRVEF
jgi:hypothetical protein